MGGLNEENGEEASLHTSLFNQTCSPADNRQLCEVLDALPTAVYMTDAAGCITYYNQPCVAMAGRTPVIGTDSWCVTWRLYWPDGVRLPHEECPMAVALKEARPIYGEEAMAERPDGTRVSFLAYPTPLRNAVDEVVGAINMLVDITERKLAESHQRWLADELNHRVKNTLTTVLSIAAQSFRTPFENSDYQWFEGRLIALSKAHDLLSRESWEAASLHELVAQATSPLLDKAHDRFDINGPNLRLRAKMALSLAMALHELCINAAKYGALSNETGRISIHWSVMQGAEPCLHFVWKETAGPPVGLPLKKGFGSRLIERGLAGELGGEVHLIYEPDGIVCRINVPIH